MKSDQIGLYLTYGLVYIVVIGGGVMVVAYGNVMDPLVVGAFIGFIGSAITFAFGKETQKQTARQQERALLTNPTSTSTTTTYTGGSGSITTEPAAETDS